MDEALRRLAQAVTRLELAVRRAAEGETARLAAAKADYGLLAETSETVARRLDLVIGRLDRVLES